MLKMCLNVSRALEESLKQRKYEFICTAVVRGHNLQQVNSNNRAWRVDKFSIINQMPLCGGC